MFLPFLHGIGCGSTTPATCLDKPVACLCGGRALGEPTVGPSPAKLTLSTDGNLVDEGRQLDQEVALLKLEGAFAGATSMLPLNQSKKGD
jgi:hypothetical protein